MTPTELERRLNNLIQVGIISETKVASGKLLARVTILDDLVTDFLPVMTTAGAYKRKASPVRIGDQVIILSPMGLLEGGLILAGILSTDCQEPTGYNDTTEVTEYEDGTRILYDTDSRKCTVESAAGTPVLELDLTAKTASITADLTVTGTLTVSKKITGEADIEATGNVKAAASDIATIVLDFNAHSHLYTSPTPAPSGPPLIPTAPPLPLIT